jgi:hypothetical protein
MLLFREKGGDFAGALPDRGEGVEMAIRPDLRTAFGRAAGRGDFFQSLAHDRLIKYEAVRRSDTAAAYSAAAAGFNRQISGC